MNAAAATPVERHVAEVETRDGIALADVESVTYEVLTGVPPFSLTNLNAYASAATNDTDSATSGANTTFTLFYSLSRDVAYGLASAGATADAATLSFAAPTNSVYTKFWVRVGTTDDVSAMTEYGGDTGFLLPNMTQGRFTIDPAAFGIALVEGEYALGLTIAVFPAAMASASGSIVKRKG